MKKLATIFVSILIFSVTYGNVNNEEKGKAKNALMTTSVSGKVLDKITGEALVGVKVSLQGSEKNVYTDFDGNFEINSVKPGNLKLTTSYISYKKKTELLHIDLNKSNNVNVKIESITE